MTAQALHWYIARDGQQHGPISDAEMKKFVELGHLDPYDLLWRDGIPSWYPALGLLSRRAVVQQAAINEPRRLKDELAAGRSSYPAAKRASTLRAVSANSLAVLLCAVAAAALFTQYSGVKDIFLSP
jgi:GYF domain 2